jgi:hypothetical protein
MIKHSYIFFLFLIGFVSCQNKQENEVIKEELKSSKGEIIYVCSINSGVTGDNQLTAISGTPLSLEDFKKISPVRGLDPFVYSFSDDILTLYFRNKINYKIPFTFRSIIVKYYALNNAEFGQLFKNTFESKDFYAVPNNKNNKGFLGMPLPPK